MLFFIFIWAFLRTPLFPVFAGLQPSPLSNPIPGIEFFSHYQLNPSASPALRRYLQEIKEGLGFSNAMMRFLSLKSTPLVEKLVLVQALQMSEPDADSMENNFQEYKLHLEQVRRVKIPSVFSNTAEHMHQISGITPSNSIISTNAVLEYIESPNLGPIKIDELNPDELLCLGYLYAHAHPNNSLVGYYYALAALEKNRTSIATNYIVRIIAAQLLISGSSLDEVFNYSVNAITTEISEAHAGREYQNKPVEVYNGLASDIIRYRWANAFQIFLDYSSSLSFYPKEQLRDWLPPEVLAIISNHMNAYAPDYENWFLEGAHHREVICEARLLPRLVRDKFPKQ